MSQSKDSISGLQWLEQNQPFLAEIYHLTFLSEERLIDFVAPLVSPDKRNRAAQMKECTTRNECRKIVQKLVPTFRGTYKTGQRRKSDGRLRAQVSIRVIPMQYQAKTENDPQIRYTLLAFLYEHLSGLTFVCSMQEHYDTSQDLLELTPQTWLEAFLNEAAVSLGSFPLKYQVGLPIHKLRVPRQENVEGALLAGTYTVTPSNSTYGDDKFTIYSSFTVSLEGVSKALEQQNEAIDFTKGDADYGWNNPRVRKSKSIDVSDLDSYPMLGNFINCPLPPTYYVKDQEGSIKALPITTTELKKYLGKWIAEQNQRALAWMDLQEKFEVRNLWLEIVLKDHNWKSNEIKERAKRKTAPNFNFSGHISDEYAPFD